MQSELAYPSHFYELHRIEMAEELIVGLLKGVLPSADSSAIASDVRYNRGGGLVGAMDFWNRLYAVAARMKLTALPDFITEERCIWSEEDEMSLTSLTFFSVPEQLVGLPIPNPANLSDVSSYLTGNPNVREDLLQRYAATYPPYRVDRRVFLRHHRGIIGIDDGNHYCLQSLLLGETTIQAYLVAPPADGQLRNRWVPTDTLMELVRMVRRSPWMLPVARMQLAYYFRHSQAAKITYRTRVVGHERGAEIVGWRLY